MEKSPLGLWVLDPQRGHYHEFVCDEEKSGTMRRDITFHNSAVLTTLLTLIITSKCNPWGHDVENS